MTLRWRGPAVLATTCALTLGALAPSARADTPPPAACARPPATARPPRPPVVPALNYGYLLHRGDFSGSWTSFALPTFARQESFPDPALDASLVAHSTVLFRRDGQAPDWQGSEEAWRMKDAAAASAAFAALRLMQVCNSAPGFNPTAREERSDADSASGVFESVDPSYGSMGTFRRRTWTVLARSGTLVTSTRLLVEATPLELAAIDLADVSHRLRTAVASRLLGTAPAHLIRVPVDPTRRAPAGSTLLTARDLGTGWSRLPETYTGFSGGIDAFGRSGKCMPASDIAVSASLGTGYRAPGDTIRTPVSYESVIDLFRGYGPRYMALVRHYIAMGCSAVQYAVAPKTLRGIGDDALLLNPAKGVSGGPPVIVVRVGDRVAVLGLFGSGRNSSVAWKTRVATLMAARLRH